MFEGMLFEFVARDRGAKFAVTQVEEPFLVMGDPVKKWRVECWAGRYNLSAHVTAIGLGDAIRSALKGVDFEPDEEIDCICDRGIEEGKDICPVHNWDDQQEEI